MYYAYAYSNIRGMLIHAGRCEWKDEFEIERIVSHRGPVTNRSYLIKWKGYSEVENSWVTRSNIHPQKIDDYERATGA